MDITRDALSFKNFGKNQLKRESMLLDLTSLKQAVDSLNKSLHVMAQNEQAEVSLRDVLRAGVIQNFEFTYELCWKFMKRWLEHNLGSRYVDGLPRKELFRIAVESRLISKIGNWFEYHNAHNDIPQTYNEDTAQEIFWIAKRFAVDARIFLNNIEFLNTLKNDT